MESHQHIVRAYEEGLSSLNNKIAKMGGLAEQVVGQSLQALENRDRVLAENRIEQDEAIDRLEAEIETDVDLLIIKRQPVANDYASPRTWSASVISARTLPSGLWP
jgi:phosphate transport system protein